MQHNIFIEIYTSRAVKRNVKYKYLDLNFSIIVTAEKKDIYLGQFIHSK
jgi:hypothetical protein